MRFNWLLPSIEGERYEDRQLGFCMAAVAARAVAAAGGLASNETRLYFLTF
jgi:hypothetical protein